MIATPTTGTMRRAANRLTALVERTAATDGPHQRLALYALTRASAAVAERVAWQLMRLA